MTQALVSALPYLILGLVVLAVLLLLISFQQLRRGRTGSYWRIRRAAGQRGGQLFLASLTLFGLAFILALITGLGDAAYRRVNNLLLDDAETPRGVVLPSLTPTPRFSPTPPPTETPLPSATATQTLRPTMPTETPRPSATATQTPTPTLTPTATITPTPTATFESVLALTPPPSARQPRRGAAIDITAAAANISTDGRPLESATEFPAGIRRIYLFFDFRQMDNGVGWTRLLYRDGVPIQGQAYLWSLGDSGSSYFFLGDDSGYPPGSYQIRFFLGDAEFATFAFSVISPDAS